MDPRAIECRVPGVAMCSPAQAPLVHGFVVTPNVPGTDGKDGTMKFHAVVHPLVLAACLTMGATTYACKGAPEAQYSIAFASFAPLNMDIFIADADGTNPKALLSHPDQDYNASFSRDGQWIVFTSERHGSADIYRAHPDGSGFEPLVSNPGFDDQAALSPDGTFLAFVSSRNGQADIWLLELETQKLRNLTNHPEGDFRPAWSPDGNWIAFSSSRDSAKPRRGFVTQLSTEIYVMRADGSDVRRITNGHAFAGSPAWSADGKQLAIYQAPLNEASKTSSVGVARRSPQSGDRGTFQIIAIDLDTSTQRVLTSGPGEKWSPRWLPNDRIGYVTRDGMAFTSGAAGVPGEFNTPSWSADGQRAVFHRDVDTTWPPYRHWHSRDPQFALIRSGIFPSYSPQGDRLVVNDQLAGIMHNSLIVMNADGSGRSTIYTHPTKSALAPVWSRQGDRIAFALGGFFQMLPARSASRECGHRGRARRWHPVRVADGWCWQLRVSKLVAGWSSTGLSCLRRRRARSLHHERADAQGNAAAHRAA